MKKVLIVLKDVVLLSSLKRWYSRSSINDRLFFAKDGIRALEVMQTEPIDFLMTDLDLPEMDGVELVAQMIADYPSVRVVMFFESALMTADNCKKLKNFSSVYFELKPDSLKDFISFFSAIDRIENQALLAGNVVIVDILKLIECQKKNCVLTLENKLSAQKSMLYFEEGTLYDAINAGFLEPQTVVLDLLAWSQAAFSFQPLVQFQTLRKIFTSVDDLIGDNAVQRSLNTDSALDALIEKVLARVDARTKIEEAKAEEFEAQVKAEAQRIAETEALAKAEAEHQAQLEKQAQLKLEAQRIAEAEALVKAEAEHQDQLEREAKRQAELIAQKQADKEARAAFVVKLELENTLTPLETINDYLASAILDTEGNVFVRHGMSEHNIEILARNIVILIKVLIQSTNDIGLGQSSFIQLDCENSILEAVWKQNSQFIIVVLLESDSKLASLAKMKLMKVYEAMQEKL